MSVHQDLNERKAIAVTELHRRHVSNEQIQRFEGYTREIFTAFGLDLNTPATRDTPQRFIRALFDITDAYEGDPKLLGLFHAERRGEPDCGLSQMVEGPIHFFGLCEHHALPFYGHAYVGYIAHEQLIGISKLTRLVRLFAKRFAPQERIGQQIAGTLEMLLQLHGVAVYLEVQHLCTQLRGVREVAPLTRTTIWRGRYADDPSLRDEFFVMCGLGR